MQVIDYAHSFRALGMFIDEHNERADCLKNKVRQATSGTARTLISLYGKYLIKLNRLGPLDADNLPSLRTNNVQLAKLCNCSSRTIKRHLTKLEEVGIIISKCWHGSGSSYELWINPQILWINPQILWTNMWIKNERKEPEVAGHVNDRAENGEKTNFQNDDRTNCPHTEEGYFIKNNNIVKVVDNIENRNLEDKKDALVKRCLLSQTVHEDLNGDTKKGHAREDVSKNIDHGAREDGWAGPGTNPHPGKESCGAGRSTSLLVKELWLNARDKLYGGTPIGNWQEERALQLIPEFYEPVPPERLEAVHRIYMGRIDLLVDYLKRDESRFVQAPHLFFDKNNSTGFTVTKKWWESKFARKKRKKGDRVLREELEKMRRNRYRPSHQQEPGLVLYRKCEQRISRLGSEQLLRKFYRETLHL